MISSSLKDSFVLAHQLNRPKEKEPFITPIKEYRKAIAEKLAPT
jgi:hypothetical protein